MILVMTAEYHKKIFTSLIILLGISLAFFSAGTAIPDSPVYEARYLIALMTLVLTASVLINQRLCNPFADILHIVFFFFYVARSTVLLMYPLSSDLLSPPLATGVASNSTIFLILAFISLAVGCQLFLRGVAVEMGALNPRDISFLKACLWISTVIVLGNACYYAITFLQCENVYAGISNSALAILQSIFDSWRSLILLSPIIVLYGGYLSNSEKGVAIGNLILLSGIGILIGQKSTALQIILYLLFPLVLKIRSSDLALRKLALHSVLLLAFAAAGFTLGKAMRVVQLNYYGCSSGHSKLEILGNVRALLDGQGSDEISLTPAEGYSNPTVRLIDNFSYRTGYFDFFVEKHSNPAYQKVVTIQQYYMAIVDKVTPGFDVYDVPFVSRSIYYAHHPGAVPGEMTNSEQLTVFGEAGLLFGWGALLFLPFVCWLLGHLHRTVHRQVEGSLLAKYLVYLFVLQLFYYWVEGMGLDMLFVLHFLYTGIFMSGVLFIACCIVNLQELHLRWRRAP
jgi:hypothetical protein